MKKQGPGFNPEEIIFCPTSLCNLKCPHCFVEQKNCMLNIDDSIALLEDCANNIELLKVGFSGGEPFLNIEFLTEICRKAIDLGLVFDRLMTNGVWWNTKEDLNNKLSAIYDAGFDGKIGLSYDKFHGQQPEKIADFINTVYDIFNDKNCIEILSVIDPSDAKKDTNEFLESLEEIKEKTGFAKIISRLNKKTGTGSIVLQNEDGSELKIYRFAQSFIPDKNIQLKDKKWFAEDYCQYTGNVFYVHSDGNIAPCCGFANERPELFIGTVRNSFETLMKNAAKNKMVRLCYSDGLLQKATEMQKQKMLPKGKCSDMCSLCWWMCGRK